MASLCTNINSFVKPFMTRVYYRIKRLVWLNDHDGYKLLCRALYKNTSDTIRNFAIYNSSVADNIIKDKLQSCRECFNLLKVPKSEIFDFTLYSLSG